MDCLAKTYGKRFLLRLVPVLFWLGAGAVPYALGVQISDVPLDPQQLAPAPLILLLWDDSASMDGEFMTPEPQGFFDSKKYLFPDNAYAPLPDHVDGLHRCLNASQRLMWRSRWSGYNRLYYDPQRTYRPWPATRTYPFGPADLQRPWSDPTRTNAADARLQLSGPSFAVEAGGRTLVVPHAHYFVLNDLDNNGRPDAGEPLYLVAWQDADGDQRLDLGGTAGDDRRVYFRFNDDGDQRVAPGELVPLSSENEKIALRPRIIDAQTGADRCMTDREELQNFANWFTYHRRRQWAAKAMAAQLITGLRQVYVGIYALNRTPRTGVQPVRVIQGDFSSGGDGADPSPLDRSEGLIESLYASRSGGSTPLRYALDQAGRYFDQGSESSLGRSPLNSAARGGACQATHAVLVSDGFWNDDFAGVGNADGGQGRPYADAWQDTLADIALFHYRKDLASSLPDEVPSGPCDAFFHQRLRTHGFSFGVNGTVPARKAGVPRGLPDLCRFFADSAPPEWPQPVEGLPAMLDDLLHAAVNGRGAFFQMEDLLEFAELLQGPPGMRDGWMAAAGAAADGLLLDRGSILYQSLYRPADWTGEVLAVAFDPDSDQADARPENTLWRASEQLRPEPAAWDTRRILTYGGRLTQPQGIPFRYPALSDGQKRLLGSDLTDGSALDRDAAALLDYIRGREMPNRRQRSSLLGDIVHSSPVLAGRTLFVGANDGMLHALDAASGKERFAYVPNLVMHQLKALARPDYPQRHRYFVDATPSIGEVLEERNRRTTYLLGGLGKGGKGYYCLRLQESQGGDSTPFATAFSLDEFEAGAAEEALSRIVAWEYPRCPQGGICFLDGSSPIDPDMGYSFGQGYVVNANAPSGGYRQVAIFGNGYDSRNGKAVLYIVEAGTGQLIRKIDTGATGDNGLSTPALIDVDLDRRVDYAYAGDLKGNLWKFDLRSENPGSWGLAYGADLDRNGVIDAAQGDQPQPLFQAGEHQPITGRPDVMAMPAACAPGVPGFMVIFGTGRYLGEADRIDTHQQSIYALWDYGDDGDDGEYLGGFAMRPEGLLSSGLVLARRQVVDQWVENGATRRRLSEWVCDYATAEDLGDKDGISANNGTRIQQPDPVRHAGWFLDFPVPPAGSASAGERVIDKVIIRQGRAVVLSYAPTDQPCRSGGFSWLYLLSACGPSTPPGVTLDAEPMPQRFEGLVPAPRTVVKSAAAPNKDLFLWSAPSGRLIQLEIEGEKWGKVFWQHNLNDQ